jgi:altronate dehydratase large subunit
VRKTFKGYRRADGRAGVRNYIAVVPTVLCSVSVARSIAEATKTNAFPHEGGCGQVGPEREHTLRILRGVVSHPNVGAVLTVGLSCEQVDAAKLAEAAGDKPTRHIRIHDVGGNTKAVKRGIELVNELKNEIKGAEHTRIGVEELTIATQCGSSDTGSGIASNPAVGAMADRLIELGGAIILGETGSLYGAAGLMARRAATKQIGDEIIAMTDKLEVYYKRMGHSLREGNPTPGNIAGGLTTLVEKSLGGVRKGGTNTIQGVLSPGEKTMGRGLWVMNTSHGVGSCAAADMLASGAQLLAYTTGGGNPIGNPLAPVVKITATRRTIERLDDIIDFDASPVLRGDETVKECGDRLLDEMIAVANGKKVQAEKTRHTAFAIGDVAL